MNTIDARESTTLLSDAELAASAGDGDAAAFATIMRRNNRRLYRLVRSILKDDAEAEDAVQETYVRAFAGLGSFEAAASLSTWLSRIAVNEALGRLRRRRPTDDLDDIAETIAEQDVGGMPGWLGASGLGSPEAAVARREIRHVLEKAVDDLPPIFRIVFVMRAVEQMSAEETAACLGIANETVRTRFFRARRLLRERLGEQFASALEGAFPFAGARCDRIMAAVLARLAGAECGNRQLDESRGTRAGHSSVE